MGLGENRPARLNRLAPRQDVGGLSRFREHPRGLLLTPCIQHPTFFSFLFLRVKRAVPAVADHAGKRVARPLRHTVLILLIVPTVFSERVDFSRPDAIFGLFFEVYELAVIPERISSYSGTN